MSHCKSPNHHSLANSSLLCLLIFYCLSSLLTLGCDAPPDPLALFSQGRAAAAQEEWTEVRKIKNQLKEMPNANVETKFLEAILYLNVLNYRASMQRLREIAGDERIREECMIMASRIFLATGDATGAMRTLNEMIVEFPDNVDAHRLLSAKYYDFGSLQLAMKHCQRISELAPQDPRPDRLMGLISKDFDKNELAVTHYTESLKRADSDTTFEQTSEVHVELAEVQIRLRNYDAALTSLTDLPLNDMPSYLVANARSYQAECHVALGEFDEAQQCIQQALSIDAQHEHALEMHGTLAMQSGQPEQALSILLQAAAKHPGNDRILFKLSNVHRQLGNADEAGAVLTQHEQIKTLKIQYIEKNVMAAQVPTDANIRFELGKIAEQLYDVQAAASWYQAALALDPNHQAATAALNNLPPVRQTAN
ncbi:MAG: tetratricopeptide repeat protein [Planctomycetaceae bacterium]|jgi:tetratricopeptide (TPR) repeat protein|nr:tetratricopeptide repeat protein [Planctomycetaceae bacterium]